MTKLRPQMRAFTAKLGRLQREALSQPSEAERRMFLRRTHGVLADVRDALRSVSNGKCWYTESENPGALDDVDHFRPKLSVAGEDHAGYFWLAFDWWNFRYACQIANRGNVHPETRVVGGKRDHFPLLPGSVRATSPAHSTEREKPVLLDPAVREDAEAIVYTGEGQPSVHPDLKNNAVAEQRFETSRLLYHLNWPSFADDRRALIRRLRETVNDVDRLLRTMPHDLTLIRRDRAVWNKLRRLAAMMVPGAPYSATARDFLRTQRYRWWIEAIVLRLGERG
jgi:hypothetical protein